MALLKKIKASTLMETMVATVLIVVIFMMSSMLLNTIFTANVNGNTQAIQERLQELEYAYKKEKITVPYYEEWNNWEIRSVPMSYKEAKYIEFEAIHQKTAKISSSYVNEHLEE